MQVGSEKNLLVSKIFQTTVTNFVQMMTDRFVRNLLPDAQHYVNDSSPVPSPVTNYTVGLRNVCFVNPEQIGVYTAKLAPQVARLSILPQFAPTSMDFEFPNSNDAVDNKHLFDVSGETFCRIVGPQKELVWSENTQEFGVDYSHVQCRSFSSVLCHKQNQVTVALGEDRRVYMLDQTCGRMMQKSGKMYNSLFTPPTVSWACSQFPSLITVATARLVTMYDFHVESSFGQLPVKCGTTVRKVLACQDSTLVAVHHEDASVVIFDIRKPSLALSRPENGAVSLDWQPFGKTLSMINENGQIFSFVTSTGHLQPQSGLSVVPDATGIFWVNSDEVFVTTSERNGQDCVYYYAKSNSAYQFKKRMTYSSENDLFCARLDGRALFVTASDNKIYGFDLPEPQTNQVARSRIPLSKLNLSER